MLENIHWSVGNYSLALYLSSNWQNQFCTDILGWDYMIGNSETAYNKVASLVMGLKESILEEKERKKDDRNWKLIGLRVFSNFL